MQQKIMCEQVNQMDMVEYLEKLGFHPTKIIHNDYWFLSPLREEKTASFKINRNKNEYNRPWHSYRRRPRIRRSDHIGAKYRKPGGL